MIENSFYSLALNDLKYLEADMRDEEDAYNRQVVSAHMIVEYLLKSVLEGVEMDDVHKKSDLLHSHNLRKIGDVLNKNMSLNLSLPDLSFLKDFYFEARYPGDNFIIVTKDMHDKCIQIMYDVLEELKPLRSKDMKNMDLF